MVKKSVKKSPARTLKLNAETVRSLDRVGLGAVIGGTSGPCLVSQEGPCETHPVPK